MDKQEIDQVKNWTSDEARQYFIDQEKEIERLIAGRTKSEERITELEAEVKDSEQAVEDNFQTHQRKYDLLWKENQELKAQLTKSEQAFGGACNEREHLVELQNKEVERLKAQLTKSEEDKESWKKEQLNKCRNSTIDEALKIVSKYEHKHEAYKALNALKTPE